MREIILHAPCRLRVRPGVVEGRGLIVATRLGTLETCLDFARRALIGRHLIGRVVVIVTVSGDGLERSDAMLVGWRQSQRSNQSYTSRRLWFAKPCPPPMAW